MIPGWKALSCGLSRLCELFEEFGDDDRFLEQVPNSTPLLAAGDIPGFTLSRSCVLREKKRKSAAPITVENRHSEPGPDNVRTLVKITLYTLKNQAEALVAAENIFYATLDRNEDYIIGKPTPGSFSGGEIGDFCWAATRSFEPGPRPARNRSSALFVIRANKLFRILVCNRTGTVDDRFTEQLAIAIVARL